MEYKVKKSIITKFLVFTLILVVAILIVDTAMTMRVVKEATEEEKTNDIAIVSAQVNSTLEEFFYSYEKILNGFGESTILSNFVIDNINGGFDSDNEGQISDLNDQAAINMLDVLSDFSENDQYVEKFYIGTETKGFFTSSLVNVKEDYDATARPWYITAQVNPDIVNWSTPYVGALNGKYMITASKAIVIDGQVRGVIAADILLDAITEKVESSQLGFDGNLLVYSGDELIIGKAEESMTNQISNYNDITGLRIVASYSENPAEVMNDSIFFMSCINLLFAFAIMIVISAIAHRKARLTIERFINHLASIGHGQSIEPLPVKSDNEIGLIANAINEMNTIIIENESSLIKLHDESVQLTEKLLIAERIGQSGSWEYDIETQTMTFSKNGFARLGIVSDLNEIKMSLSEYIHIVGDKYIYTHENIEKTIDDFDKENIMLEAYGISKEELESPEKLNSIYFIEVFDKGTQAQYVFYAAPVVTDGKLKGFIGVSRDITIEKNREKELIKARELAEAANSAQSRFVANMSHEIRTPLNAILGFSEVIKEQNTDKKLDYYLNSINTAGNSLLCLVNDILDYSKVKADKFTAQYVPAVIGDLCEELKILFYQKIEQKNLDFEIIYDTEAPTFMLPTATIRQVLINIIGNAVKFTHTGMIALRAKAIKDDDGRYNILISVTDTGVGIPKDKLESIFDEFEQADSDHQEIGTGLGLALSVNFAKLIGGVVRVESQVDKGSMFELSLKDVKLASNEVQAMHNIRENQNFKFHGQKVLILDDVLDNREVFEAHCNNMNLEPKTYENGNEALADLDAFNPDLIITDLRMPKMNGEEFAKNVRALTNFKEIPIICITASINPEENYHLENFNDVLNKPISSHKLSVSISKYLSFDLLNEEEIDVEEFNLQIAFRSLKMKSKDFVRFKEEHYEEIYKNKVGLNPKKMKRIAIILKEFGLETGNDTLRMIGENLDSYCQALDISNMMDVINNLIKFLQQDE